MKPTKILMLVTLGAALAGCPKKTADLELDLAKQALDEARRRKASDCAKETYQAAEAAIAAARKAAEDGDIDKAKKKAGEAKALADQAAAASRPGCDDKKAEAEPDPEPATAPTANASMAMTLKDALQTIYFDYNQSSLRDESKGVLNQVADILRRDPGLSIEIEGHCDIRGSTEYNLQLGELRARKVMKYLVAQGVDAKQIRIISYGEERPVDLGMSEDAHQQNRRAELQAL